MLGLVQHERLRQRVHEHRLEIDDLRQLAVHALALASEKGVCGAAARATEHHRLGAGRHVRRDVEGSTQAAGRVGGEGAAWQWVGVHRDAVKRDRLQVFTGAEVEVEAHVDLAQVFQHGGGFLAHHLLAVAEAERRGHAGGNAQGVVHFGPAVHGRRQRHRAGHGVEGVVRVHQHAARAGVLRERHAVGVGRALPCLDGLADLVHGEGDWQA